MIFLGLDEIEVFRSLFYWISSLIYQLIKTLYDIFERLCNSRILDSEVLRIISGRIGLLLGIIMFFMVTFSVIQLMLEPDKLTDKEKGVGNIVKKVLLVIVMLSCSNIAFGAMYGLQKEIIENNIIEKFILPYNVDDQYFGGILSMELFTSFYTLNPGVEHSDCAVNYETLKNNIVYYNDFSVGKACLKTKVNDTYVMDFDVLLLPIVGGVAVWFLFSYCITVGVRTMQLAFLEIMSPMAIISYLSPKKDTMFQKWWKNYFATYIDVFIRIAIINLVVFLIAVIFSTDFQGTFLESVGIGEQKQDGDTLIIVLIVLALLTFAKKAPELLKTFFPEGDSKLGGFGAKTPKKMFSDMLFGDKIQKYGEKGLKAIGRLPLSTGKRFISAVDSATHGKGFWNGWNRHPGKFGQWLNKQRETLTPEANRVYKDRLEGNEYRKTINDKYARLSRVASRLMKLGYGGSSDKDKYDKETRNWTKALDGKNRYVYDYLFNSKEFANAKFNLDRASNYEESIIDAISYFKTNLNATTFEGTGKDGKPQTFNRDDNLEDLLRGATKTKKGLEDLYNNISKTKEAEEDVKIVEAIKFGKGNPVNPVDSTVTHRSQKIDENEKIRKTEDGKNIFDDSLIKNVENTYNELLDAIANNADSSVIEQKTRAFNDAKSEIERRNNNT